MNWAIVGAGTMGNEMAQALLAENGEVYGIYNHHLQKALDFAGRYSVLKVFESEEELLSDPEVDIIYIAVPHNFHFPLMKKALAAGKNLLVEKAITVNSEELSQCVLLAKEHGCVLMEAMTIFHMPIYKELAAVLKSGALGRVKLVQVNFGSQKEYDENSRFFSPALAGGALLDIGVYALSFARFFMSGAAKEILTTVDFAPTGVDELSGIIVKSENETAVTALSLRAKQPKRGVVSCERGYIELSEYPRADTATIFYSDSGKREKITAGSTDDAIRYELRDMECAVREKGAESTLPLSVDVMDMMTKIRGIWEKDKR